MPHDVFRESTMGLFRMDPENSGTLGLHHIEFNHLSFSLFFPFVGYTLLSYANHIATGMQRTVSGFEKIGVRPRKSVQKGK